MSVLESDEGVDLMRPHLTAKVVEVLHWRVFVWHERRRGALAVVFGVAASGSQRAGRLSSSFQDGCASFQTVLSVQDVHPARSRCC